MKWLIEAWLTRRDICLKEGNLTAVHLIDKTIEALKDATV